ncbi:TctA family transporter [Methanophagales archaeon]|jgi:hypothetical protein|nr:TctA family transporter [Methanophagales archaeon]
MFWYILPLLLLIAFSMLGVLLGTITGLIPGFHPNNVASILLAIAPMLLAELQFFSAFGISATILVVSVILTASVAHTSLSFIPVKLTYTSTIVMASAILLIHLSYAMTSLITCRFKIWFTQ